MLAILFMKPPDEKESLNRKDGRRARAYNSIKRRSHGDVVRNKSPEGH